MLYLGLTTDEDCIHQEARAKQSSCWCGTLDLIIHFMSNATFISILKSVCHK